jgi:hypothetical protein
LHDKADLGGFGDEWRQSVGFLKQQSEGRVGRDEDDPHHLDVHQSNPSEQACIDPSIPHQEISSQKSTTRRNGHGEHAVGYFTVNGCRNFALYLIGNLLFVRNSLSESKKIFDC